MNDAFITIKIDPVGRATIEGHGFTGSTCMEKAKPIIDALSNGNVETVAKPEMAYIETDANEHEHLSN